MAAAIISAIIGVVSAIAGIVGTVVSSATTASEAEKDRELVKETNEQQREYELEDREYLAQREDTAYQRKAQDMAKAGINPLMAGIGQGANSGVQTARNTGNIPSSIAGVLGSNILTGMNGIAGTINQTGGQISNQILGEEERIARIDKLRAETQGIDEATREKIQENMRRKIELETYREQKLAELKNVKITNEHLEQVKKESIERLQISLDQEQREKLKYEMDKVTRQIEDDIAREELKYKKHENEMTELEKKMEQERLEALKQNKVVQIIDKGLQLVDTVNDIKNSWWKPWEWGKNKKNNNNNKGRRKKGK